ncbi:MAG: VRR-NUC domain-containing protein, partial [Deltaproteobacteria bacterium]|nr:VRR-NUC domain-containing protein [Deltaproteobacteria bacterium]
YEEQEQESLVIWLYALKDRLEASGFPKRLLFHAIPNGGKRDKATAARLKRAGVSPGVPDIFLPVPIGGFPGLYVEMKRAIGGKSPEAQKKWQEGLRLNGYRVEVCKGCEAARAVILDYLGL